MQPQQKHRRGNDGEMVLEVPQDDRDDDAAYLAALTAFTTAQPPTTAPVANPAPVRSSGKKAGGAASRAAGGSTKKAAPSAVDIMSAGARTGLASTDILPALDTLQCAVHIPQPSTLKTAFKNVAAVMKTPTITFWIRNNTAEHARAAAAGTGSGNPPATTPWAGISVDSACPLTGKMAVARIPMSPVSVHVDSTSPGHLYPDSEVGVAVEFAKFLRIISRAKEPSELYLFVPKAGQDRCDHLHISIVDSARGAFSTTLPLTPGDRDHKTVADLILNYELLMPVETLKADLRSFHDDAGLSGAEQQVMALEIRRWLDRGLQFVLRTGTTIQSYGVTYVSALRQLNDGDAVAALEAFQKARATYHNCADSDEDTRRRFSGIVEAEDKLRTKLFEMYDALAVPDGFVKPPRDSTSVTPVEAIEKEVRMLLQKAHAHRSKTTKYGCGGEQMDALNAIVVETAGVLQHAIAGIPLKQKEIDSLPVEYSQMFFVNALYDATKTPSSGTVAIKFPADPEKPLVLRFDLGNGAYVAVIIMPAKLVED